MTEEFLHYLWKFQKFDGRRLTGSRGEEIRVLKTGFHNHDAGPDFNDARIRINDQLWAGNLEIHIRSSDWFRHNHHLDKAYNNVILHVVYEDDHTVTDADDNPIPTLVLKGLFDEYQYWRYEQMLRSGEVIPCASQLNRVDTFIKENTLERVLVERLKDKSQLISGILDENNEHWEESFYQWLCRGFGLRVNAEPMLMLARSLPLKVLVRHRGDLFQMEALLFGVSGLNVDPQDDYSRSLEKEFAFLKKKYKLEIMDGSIWKFSRLRPSSFPTLRLAQFAGLMYSSDNVFSEVISTGEIEILKKLLKCEGSLYWKQRYRFGGKTKTQGAVTGDSFIQVLIINVIVPFLFIYGYKRDEPFFRQRSLDLLDQLSAEENKYTRMYEKLNFEMKSAFHTQAVLQLHKNYCEPKKCLNCAIGTQLLK